MLTLTSDIYTQSVILSCNITFTAPFLPPSHVASLVVVVTQFYAALQNSNKIKQLFTNIDFYAHAAYTEDEERSVFKLMSVLLCHWA